MFRKLGDTYTATYNIIVEVPSRAFAFWNVGYEGYDFVLFLIKHWNLINDGTTIGTNLAADWYHIARNIFTVGYSAYNLDFFNSARNLGELLPILLN